MVGRLPTQASQLYATNLVNLLKLLCKEKNGAIDIDFDDVVLRGVTVIKQGEITWPAPPIPVSVQQPVQNKPMVEKPAKQPASPWNKLVGLATGVGAFAWIASVAPAAFLGHFTVFVLACVVGYYVVWNVTHALHTPLMSVTNAISGIIIVGALVQIGQGNGIVTFLAFIAVLIASINIFGGFTVTKRMLDMFRKD
ncbi:NAD(P) transhydrogenase subunit alpha [Vibrio metschnikovii]|nr:NAD(P) transhydrogenase subunit alpha [Vibrio metschnikovii]